MENLEKIIADAFSISIEELTGRSIKSQHAEARAFLWLILHYTYGISTAKIAREYKKTPRAVNYALAKTKYLIGLRKDYADIYTRICNKLNL